MEHYFRYIPVRPRDECWGLYVTAAGSTSIPPGAPYPPPGHPKPYGFSWSRGRTLPDYQVSCVVRGEGTFESKPTGARQIVPGTCFMVFPGVWHRYRPLRKVGWDSYWISFRGEVVDRLAAQGFFSPEHAVLSVGFGEVVPATFERLVARVRRQEEGFSHLIAADTLEILAAVLTAGKPESQEVVMQGPLAVKTVTDPIVADAVRLIWGQSGEAINVEDIVRRLPLTRRSLERRFRKELGLSIHEEIHRCRMDRAVRLLTCTDLLIKNVAGVAGFPSVDAMETAFRRAHGASPSEYRERYQHDSPQPG